METINLLSEDLINKIAAGEVVERPASVVKELVENSLDAGASRIVVEVKDSGKKLIRISDDGHGMSAQDARKSILRHATSKIRTDDDLFSIQTLGFRGEALASIAAVSHLSLTTKQKDALEGLTLKLEGGMNVHEGVSAADTGTTIEVSNLFFNTPARKKFLKTDAVELRHIIDVVTRYALLHPAVSFKLIHEGHELLCAPAAQDMRSNIASIYGVGVAKELLEVTHEDEFAKIKGFIAKPYAARNDKNQQVLFVNGRWVRSAAITQAIYDALKSLLFVGKHPVFVLQLDLDPQRVDVNIHPQKTQIKIEQRDAVCEAVKRAVQTTLQEHNLMPVVDVEFDGQMTIATSRVKSAAASKDHKYSFDPSSQTVLEVREPSLILSEEKLTKVVQSVVKEDETKSSDDGPRVESSKVVQKREDVVETTKEVHERLPPLRLLGQFDKTFFIAETQGGIVFIDQHAAHERVMLEKFTGQLIESGVEVQTLLQGEVIELLTSDVVMVNEYAGLLESFGFTLEHFGDNSFVLKTVPLIFGRLQPKELLFDVLAGLQDGKSAVKDIKETLISRMACHAAYRAGEELTNVQVQNLLRELGECKHPFSCAHGRPTMIKTTRFELEKKFRRC